MMRAAIGAISLVILVATWGCMAIEPDPLASVNCQQITAGGYNYNLSALLGTTYVKVYTGTDNKDYQYTWRLCAALANKCHNISGVVNCQAWQPYTSTSNQRSCGLFSTYSVSNIGKGAGIVITYNQGESNRQSSFTINCGSETNAQNWQLTNQGTTYAFTISHTAGCASNAPASTTGASTGRSGSTTGSKKKKSGGGSSKGGLSGGWIFIIILVCLTFTYFVGGILFLKFVKKAEGKEIVPNVGFWSALPGLIKDGVVFTFQKIKGLVNKIRGKGDGSYQQV